MDTGETTDNTNDVRLSSWNLERILTNWYSRSCGYLLNGIITKLYRKWSIKRTQREIVYLVKESHKEHKTVLLQMVSVSSIIEMLQTLNRRGKDWWGNWCHHFFLNERDATFLCCNWQNNYTKINKRIHLASNSRGIIRIWDCTYRRCTRSKYGIKCTEFRG